MTTPKTRRCSKCQETKVIEAFARYNKGQRIRSSCTSCRNIEKKQRQEASSTHPEKYARKLQRTKELRFLRKYGLTQDQYHAMVAARDGLCDICKQPETRVIQGKLQNLCVDHVEGTKVVRGLLCSNHNVGIGLFGHSPQLLELAAAYLRK